MKIQDLYGGDTWILGTPFHFLKYVAQRRKWTWTGVLAKATSFPTKEAAEKALKEDPGVKALMADTNPVVAGSTRAYLVTLYLSSD